MLKSVGLVQPSVNDHQRKSTPAGKTVYNDNSGATINSITTDNKPTLFGHRNKCDNNNITLSSENKSVKCKQCYIKSKIKLKDYVSCNHIGTAHTRTHNGNQDSLSWSRNNKYQRQVNKQRVFHWIFYFCRSLLCMFVCFYFYPGRYVLLIFLWVNYLLCVYLVYRLF